MYVVNRILDILFTNFMNSKSYYNQLIVLVGINRVIDMKYVCQISTTIIIMNIFLVKLI